MSPTPPLRRRVLVLGAYFADRDNHAAAIRDELRRSKAWHVDQRWVALGDAVPSSLADVTVAAVRGVPKFTLLNRLLRDVELARYAYVVVCDDDIVLAPDFLDGYLEVVEELGFALAQPARTHDSFTDHQFVSQLLGLKGRQTRFVEIGPLFSMRADAAALLAPFDETSPMGWGYDFVWPLVAERAGLSLGIVDAFPVAHNLRKPVTSYSHATAHSQMVAYLSRHAHLAPHDAFQIVKSFI